MGQHLPSLTNISVSESVSAAITTFSIRSIGMYMYVALFHVLI